MNKKLIEVMTEEQYVSLREMVFLSLLHEVMLSQSSSPNENESPISEQTQLLTSVFGMSQAAIDERVRKFMEYRSKKQS
jgi:hypothetical protein